MLRVCKLQGRSPTVRSESENARSAEEVSAAVSREYGHTLADKYREGSGTSDEVVHPK